ncbi:MAG: diiron oxygenase, partial [Phycisphaerae bacterium]|nr:diiron oxygenase [Phycisphaerae bacterium]
MLTLPNTGRRRPTLQQLRSSRHDQGPDPIPEPTRPVDSSRDFICPTVTPLYYCPIYQQLTDLQRRTYNQITAMSFNELIALFEQIGSAVLASMLRRGIVDPDLTACLHRFIEDEHDHIERWRTLNVLSDPAYTNGSYRINVKLARLRHRLVRLARRPERWTAVFWLMLLQEERSLDLSRRCARSGASLDPCYAQMYAHHMRDEVRHVQLDWHLIDRYYAKQSTAMQRANAELLRVLVSRFFLPPLHSAKRVVHLWMQRQPELWPFRQT